jgi:hypothetical protein
MNNCQNWIIPGKNSQGVRKNSRKFGKKEGVIWNNFCSCNFFWFSTDFELFERFQIKLKWVQFFAQLCWLELIFQIVQSSNWGKEWSIVLSKYCTNIWLTCILSIPRSKKIMNSQKRYQLSKIWKLLEIWSTKEFSSVATILPGLKSGQGVLPSGLQTFPYHMGNMHNRSSKIRKDTTLLTLLTIKQTIEILLYENWIMGLCLDPWNKCFPSSRIFENLHTCRTDYKEHFVFCMCGLSQFQLILKKCWPNLMVHTTQNLTLNFNLDFEIQQYLGSLKHVINIIIPIRDTGRYI